MRVRNAYIRARATHFCWGFAPKEKCVKQVENHFYEMKGDVGMSLHEKGRNKKMSTPRHKVTHNPIPTSLFCFNMLFVCYECTQHLDIQLPAKYVMLWSWKKQRCRDGVMSDFVSWCRHLLVPSFFMK